MAVRALTGRPAEDRVLELSGDIDGLPADPSENLDRYLDETFVAEPRAPYRARRRRRHVLGFDHDFVAAGFTLWRGVG